MNRRTFIRCLLVVLLLLSLGLWAWSYPYREHVCYNASPGGTQIWVFEIGSGTIFIGRNWGGWQGGAGWHYEHLGRDYFDDLDSGGFHLLGFQIYASPAPPTGMGSFVNIPLWFVTTVFALALIFVWLPKQRGKSPPGFPAIMSDSEGRK